MTTGTRLKVRPCLTERNSVICEARGLYSLSGADLEQGTELNTLPIIMLNFYRKGSIKISSLKNIVDELYPLFSRKDQAVLSFGCGLDYIALGQLEKQPFLCFYDSAKGINEASYLKDMRRLKRKKDKARGDPFFIVLVRGAVDEP